MRIRTIKPEFFLHHELYRAERESKLPLRLAFAGLWCAADREGRFRWEPRRLGVCILPYDKLDFSRVLDALVTRGFLEKYGENGTFFGSIPGFSKHQFVNPKEKASELPPPPKRQGLQCGNQQLGTREERDDDAIGPREILDCLEGKGKEGIEHSERDAKPAKPRVGFQKPTIDELRLAMSKAGLPESEAERFINHYESNGWRVGKNPMVSWPHAVGTWAATWRERNGGLKPKAPGGPLSTPARISLEKQLESLKAELAQLKSLRHHERQPDWDVVYQKKFEHAAVIQKRLEEGNPTEP